MIVCPSCNHQNPEGSIQCERCYTLLPTTAPCPNCGASVQSDATFCGQCGFNLQADQVAKQDNGLTNPFSFLEEDTEDLSLDNTIPTVVGNTPIVSPWDEEESEDITLGQPMSDDDTEIMNPYASSLESETPLNLDLPKTEKMPWEISNSELNSEISELLDLNTSELKIPDIPEVDAINLDENGEAPELPEMGIPELDLSQEAPELPEMGIPELDLSQEAPELPEMDTSELEVSAEIPELPEMDTSELEVSAEIPELPEMDTSELEVSAE
ncbi:MAG: zinc ribbon domain-containing protein, partial [Xenococcaceae cyanobacterium MO_207.B15]|nr:zinc ribbon domain-containing protein [Xenococcaceae cyanobacterium MO_207.B15]